MGKVGAPIGNTNPQIWTLEKSNELLDKAIALTDEMETVIVDKIPVEAYKFDFIGEIARELDIYRDLIPRDIKKHHPELTEKINKLINRLEANCYSNTKKGKINTAVGIVNLKSNHGWTDRQQIEQHQTNIDLSNLSTEEIKALLKDE
jgi:hypothetical protein